MTADETLRREAYEVQDPSLLHKEHEDAIAVGDIRYLLLLRTQIHGREASEAGR